MKRIQRGNNQWFKIILLLLVVASKCWLPLIFDLLPLMQCNCTFCWGVKNTPQFIRFWHNSRKNLCSLTPSFWIRRKKVLCCKFEKVVTFLWIGFSFIFPKSAAHLVIIYGIFMISFGNIYQNHKIYSRSWSIVIAHCSCGQKTITNTTTSVASPAELNHRNLCKVSFC